ncbi:MAG: glycosyl hydrolase 115 family protein, partial [Kiritimatiellae bacterium]|nr:glycosyl hydrolase 115 family protein [Kiritimatiellia bacterium]
MKMNQIWCTVQVWLLIFAAFPVTSRAGEPFRVGRGRMPKIVLMDGMRPFVARAASDVAGDLEKIFGERPAVTTGSVATADAILVTKGGAGWENYTLESKSGNVLTITGSDDRGAMFGIYRFASECLGVDPFYRWSGREPAKASVREWDSIAIHQGNPSFRFRAWFINDEDFLNGFRPEENGKREIAYPRYHVCFGPSLADEIYETAVRAGFNTVICASYVDILNPDEKRLVDVASSRGLYITMHHQEPVGAGARQLDLHFPEIKETSYASHPDLWRKAWKKYVEEWAKVPDVIWQLGLRGRGDRPFWLNAGEKNSPDVSEEEDRRRAGLISRAMAEQLAMIEAELGHRPAYFATQLWMEGAEYYRRGFLSIPQGTIIIFSDNCPGLKFQSDIGGVRSLDPSKPYGLYYHLALVHGNHRCELVPPLRTRQILDDAWRKGARELALFNVSNIRPFLYTIEAAAEMTRDLSGFDATRFRDSWAAARFGRRASAAARAIDLYFAAYETVYSRDAKSSYGSPRERAPLAILNDGLICNLTRSLIRSLKSDDSLPVAPVVSQYIQDPNRLTVIADDLHARVNQDMFPYFQDGMRCAVLARAQSAAFRRCLEQIERASDGMDAKQRLQLFERFGYPAEFLSLSSDCYSELAFAAEAKSLGDQASWLHHVQAALDLSEARDRLDRRYNAGRWKRWYDRDIIYPYTSFSAALRQLVASFPADTLRQPDGSRVTSAEGWNKVRPQILRFFEEEVYGAFPPKPAK